MSKWTDAERLDWLSATDHDVEISTGEDYRGAMLRLYRDENANPDVFGPLSLRECIDAAMEVTR
jgi:hypothetical protein